MDFGGKVWKQGQDFEEPGGKKPTKNSQQYPSTLHPPPPPPNSPIFTPTKSGQFLGSFVRWKLNPLTLLLWVSNKISWAGILPLLERVGVTNGKLPSKYHHEIYCAFHKHANSEVQKPTDDCVFFYAVNHLNGPIRKQYFTLTGSKGHGFWFVIGGFRSVFSGFVACDRNYDWRQRKTELWRRLLNVRVRMFVKSAVTPPKNSRFTKSQWSND